jgi:hypothetical protein
MCDPSRFALVVGFDLSHCSPAMTLYFTRTKTWESYAFAQRLREEGFQYKTKSASVRLLPYFKKIKEDVKKHVFVSDGLMRTLNQRVASNKISKGDVDITIEDYVFSRGKQKGNHQLHEVGGIIKYLLETNGYYHVSAVRPDDWKRVVIHKSRAKKDEVVTYITSHGPCINMNDILHLDVCPDGSIKVPAQDLADSAAIVVYKISQLPIESPIESVGGSSVAKLLVVDDTWVGTSTTFGTDDM